MSRALVLLSGGYDSAVVLAKACKAHPKVAAMWFDYKQPAVVQELAAAKLLASRYGTYFYRRSVELPESGITLPGSGSPVVYGRNTVFLSIACAHAQAFGVDIVYAGFSGEDEELFPDCRPGYLDAMNTVQQKVGGPRIVAPLLGLSRAEVRQLGAKLDVPRHLTWSCYFPTREGQPCGECLSCKQDH